MEKLLRDCSGKLKVGSCSIDSQGVKVLVDNPRRNSVHNPVFRLKQIERDGRLKGSFWVLHDMRILGLVNFGLI